MTDQLSLAPPHPLYTLNPVLSQIVVDPIIGLDTETRGLKPWRDELRLIQLRTDNKTFLIQPAFYTKEELTAFFKRCADSIIVAHGTKFDAGFIYCKYGVLFEKLYCTMLASQVYYGGSRKYRHGLADVLSRELHIHIGDRSEKKENQKSFAKRKQIEMTPEQLGYAAKDVEYLLPLREHFLAKIPTRGLEKIILLENKLTPGLIEMEARGCLIDVVGWKRQLVEWEAKRKEILTRLDAEVMRLYPMSLFANVNYGSPKQVLGLFKDMKLPVPTKTERKGKEVVVKESVDEDTLQMYLNEQPETPMTKFIEILLEYREYDKLLTTYGDAFLTHIDKDGYVHTTYSQCSTKTFRTSSKEPNLQNQPSDKSGEGGKLRQYFIAPPGYKMITCDMTGAEIALAADLSKDPILVDNHVNGADMHSQLCSVSFSVMAGQPFVINKSKEPVTLKGVTFAPVDARDVHKSVTFAKFYLGGADTVFGVLARYISKMFPPQQRKDVAKRISEALDQKLSFLIKFLKELVEKANKDGYLVVTKLGRRMYFDGKVYGEAANSKMQAGCADAMKIALINARKYLVTVGGWAVLTVHDELVSVVPDKHVVDAAKQIETIVADALTACLNDLKGKAVAHYNDYWDKGN